MNALATDCMSIHAADFVRTSAAAAVADATKYPYNSNIKLLFHIDIAMFATDTTKAVIPIQNLSINFF